MIRTVIISLSTFLFVSTPAMADEFCRGFEHGYITGYQQSSGSSLEPLTPLCPLQPLKKLNDPDSDFEHGYLIGLARGFANGKK
jgi:hypothetical protein